MIFFFKVEVLQGIHRFGKMLFYWSEDLSPQLLVKGHGVYHRGIKFIIRVTKANLPGKVDGLSGIC